MGEVSAPAEMADMDWFAGPMKAWLTAVERDGRARWEDRQQRIMEVSRTLRMARLSVRGIQEVIRLLGLWLSSPRRVAMLPAWPQPLCVPLQALLQLGIGSSLLIPVQVRDGLENLLRIFLAFPPNPAWALVRYSDIRHYRHGVMTCQAELRQHWRLLRSSLPILTNEFDDSIIAWYEAR